MAGSKEIKAQIRSISNTQKITNAMEMVAASKMRKAQDRMQATRPYAQNMRKLIANLSAASADFKHPYLQDRPEVRNIGIIVISTDRGLCGGLNVNLFKAALGSIKSYQQQGVGVKIATVGKKASAFFNRTGSVVAHVDGLGDKPRLHEMLGCITGLLGEYEEGKIDRLLIVKNNFINAMSQQPQIQQLLPAQFEDADDAAAAHNHSWDYLYEPNADELLLGILKRYIESQVYQAIVENVACEMSARMIAMKSATDNAGELIKTLNLQYNKARQAAITQELSEIVGGAAAV